MVKALTLTILLLSLSLPSFTLPSFPTGLDSFLSSYFLQDPTGTNDSFLTLPSSLRPLLSLPLPSPPLPSLSVTFPVTVKLTGPSFSSVSPSLLQTLVTNAVTSSLFNSVSSPHLLAVSHRIQISVSLSSPSLSSSLSHSLSSHFSSSPSPFHSTALSSVPYSVVDSIIQSDFQSDDLSASSPSFYIYLINLGGRERNYAYSFDSSQPSPAYSKCFGTVWAGTDRYVWIDLGAGPVDYGPALSGEGLLPKGEFHPLATLHGRPKSERLVLADLSSLVIRVYEQLIVPSLRIPVFYENNVEIRFVHVNGFEQRDPVGLDWELIEKTIKEGNLGFKNQNLVFKSYSIKYSDCPVCSFAIAKSTNSFTSRFLFENYTLIVSEYLDSKRLRQILSDSSEEINRLIGITELEYTKVIPVFVFDLELDKILLLDRFHQAVAFKDMVVSIRTKSSQTVSDYSCNGRHVITLTRNLDRPLIGSILQSVWGISPTHLSFSPAHNNSLVDYTFSTGQTPFGPFSESLSLSFVQKHAAKRNVLLTTLNYTITSMIDVMESMNLHGGEKMLHGKKRHVEFVQRWNFFRFKLEKVASVLSRLDYEKAMYYLKSSDHDLYAIHKLVYDASQEMEARLSCFEEPPFPWVSVSVSVCFVLGFFYVVSKKDKIFRNKRKRF